MSQERLGAVYQVVVDRPEEVDFARSFEVFSQENVLFRAPPDNPDKLARQLAWTHRGVATILRGLQEEEEKGNPCDLVETWLRLSRRLRDLLHESLARLKAGSRLYDFLAETLAADLAEAKSRDRFDVGQIGPFLFQLESRVTFLRLM